LGGSTEQNKLKERATSKPETRKPLLSLISTLFKDSLWRFLTKQQANRMCDGCNKEHRHLKVKNQTVKPCVAFLVMVGRPVIHSVAKTLAFAGIQKMVAPW